MHSTTTTSLSPAQDKLRQQVTGPQFPLYLLKNLPMGWLAGIRVRELSPERCVTSVPFKWLNKNPFRSIYFAVQSMAAELSTAANCMLAVTGQAPSVAFIIVDMKASFSKKATDRVFFTCEDTIKAFEAVQQCIETGESHAATFETVGRMADGTEVSRFEFTWSFKQRKAR
ncbi:MAG: DUF4442 domain-containing protein [Bacteroidota bacterium]